MYYQNHIKGRFGRYDFGPIAVRMARDLSRVYPGVGSEPICPNKPGFRLFPGAGPVVHYECDGCV